MKIVINAIPLLAKLTGIGKYTYYVSKYLKEKENVTFFYGYFSKEIHFSHNPPTPPTFLKKIIKKILRKIPSKEFDIYFEPNFNLLPNLKAKKNVITVHDFSFLKKEWHPKERYEYFQKNFFPSVERTDYIIANSFFTKSEILKYTSFNEKKIKVIYLGADKEIFKVYPKEELDNFKRKLNLPDKFLLFVGSIEPRKNLKNLLLAYNEMDIDYKLLLVGAEGWKNSEIHNLITKNPNILYLGYLSEKELAYLYNLCSLFIYPSIYEGFGLPPLEAINCNAKVLLSNIEVFREIYKDGVFYIDNPLDIKSIQEGILNALNSSKKDTSFLKDLSWEKCANEHLEFFRKINAGDF